MKRICLLLLLCMGIWVGGMGCPAPNPGEKTEETSTEKKTEQIKETAVENGDEPEPAAEPDAAPEPTPEPDAAPEPTPEPDAAPEPTPEPDAAPEPTPEPDAAPEPTPENGETVTEPVQDGGETTTEPVQDGGEVTIEPVQDGGEVTTEPVQDGGEVTTEPTPDAGETTPETTTETTTETTGDQPPQNTPSASAAAQITSALAGTVGSIDGAAVTYLKPKVGNDPEGFFLQATQTGPAIFVVATLSSLTPQLKVGDIVSLTTATINTTSTGTGAGNNAGRTATVETFTNLKVLGGGYNVSQLTQDISQKTDVVTNVGDYEYELVKTELKITSGFTAAGTGFVAATAETASITGNADLQFRIPASATGKLSIAEELGIINGCTIEVANTPMWRFAARAQISANDKAEVTVKSCPLPTVASAKALSATTVAVTFTSPIDPASLMANGSQFSFNNGLVASAATLSSPEVVEVTTGSQTTGTSYTVTVGVTIKDRGGQALDATKNTATFAGFGAGPKVVINEVAAHIADGCDLIELRVMADVNMDGWKLQERTTTGGIITFPVFNAKKNDLIVIHMNKGDAKCNPGSSGDETTSITQVPKSMNSANYDTAYDFYSSDTGITSTDNVLTLYDKSGNIVDAVFLADNAKAGMSTGTAAGSTESQAAIVAGANEWKPSSGTPPTSYVDADFNLHAVPIINKSNSQGGLITENSAQRKSNTDTNTPADWNLTSPTFGALNVGQTTLP